MIASSRTPHDTSRWAHPHRFESGAEAGAERRTRLVLIITVLFMVGEITAGILFNSMALQADGWHMFTHVGALGLSAYAYGFARRHADDPSFAFGTGKVGALAGYSSALLLLGIAGLVVWESVNHLVIRPDVAFMDALPVAVLGLAVNGLSAWILGGGHEHHGHDHHEHHDHPEHHDHHHHAQDHNLRAAYVHVLADAATSILAIGALAAGQVWGLWWLDPVTGLVGAGVIANWSVGLIKGSSAILLDRADHGALAQQVRDAVEGEGNSWVADLHLWRVSAVHHAAIVSVVNHGERDPAYYKARIAEIDGLAHVTVEVNACPDHHGTPS